MASPPSAGLRTLGVLTGALAIALLPRLIAAAQTGGDATPVLTAARQALGAQKLAGVTTLAATGRTQQLRGQNLVSIEFEIDIELPDKYVRTDEVPAQESGPTRRGFSGDTLIQFPVPSGRGDAAGRGAGGRGPGGPPPPAGPPGGIARGAGDGPGRGGPPATPMAPPDPVLQLKQDFARLMLGMFATDFPVYPLTFSYAGVAEAPEGKADAVDVRGSGNFAARLFVSAETHLPVMLSWQTSPTVENRIYYADFRDVNGFKFPFRMRRATGATTIEETTFDRFRINPRIDPKRFEVRP